MSFSLRQLALAVTLLVPALAQAPALAAAQEKNTVEVNGRLNANDANDPVRRKPARVYEIKLMKGKAYVIDLMSDDFDAYLRLVNGAGNQVASDDDGGEGLNSRIRYTAADDETLKIYVTTFAGGTGAFSLKVDGPGAQLVEAKQGAQPAAAPAPAAAEVVLNVKGNVQLNDAADPVQQNPGKVHDVKLKKGVPYVIDMKSQDFDTFLRLEDDAGKELAQDDDSGGGLDSRIRFTPDKDGTFKIFATSFDGGNGAYSLVVRSAPAGNDALPAPVAGKPAEVTGVLEQNGEKDAVRNAPARTYTVELKAGKTYVIDLTSADFDSYLRLEAPNGRKIAQDDDGGGNLNSRISFECPNDGRYRLIATTFNGRVGEFVLRVTEQ